MNLSQLLPRTNRDAKIVITASAVRTMGYGFLSVFLGVYLSLLDFTAFQAGIVFSGIMAGGALSNIVASWKGDAIGRKRMLIAMSVLMVVGGLLFSLTSSMVGMALIGLIAMTSSSGGDRTAFLSLDTTILAQASEPRDRTNLFVWYNLLGLATKALGALLIAVPPILQSQIGLEEVTSFKVLLGVYSVIAAAGIILYGQLSPQVETEQAPKEKERGASTGSKGIIFKMTTLSALDAFGGGLMTRAFMAFWFVNQFGATPGVIAAIFSVGQIMNVISVSMAAPVANRIGLLNTMAFTQLFSNLFIAGIVFAGNLWLAVVFFFLREVTNEMDIPTRQSYTMAIVPAESRIAMASMSNLGRTVAQTISPTIAGAVAQLAFLGAPILAGSGVKIVYNILLYLQFRSVEAPEVERRQSRNASPQSASQPEGS